MHSYSYTRLNKAGRDVRIFSMFRDHPQFPVYIVELQLCRGPKLVRRIQRSVTRIETAYQLHDEFAMKFVGKNYSVVSSNA